MVPIRYWRMVLGNLTPKPSDRDVEVEKITPRFIRDVTGKVTDEIEGYNLSFICLKGCTQTVKLPLESAETVKKIQDLTSNGLTIVRVKFNGLSMKAYSMIVHNEIMSGISASAKSIEITSVETPEIDDIEIDFGN